MNLMNPFKRCSLFLKKKTESSVTRENSASSSHVANTFVNVISDPIALSVDTNYTVLEDVSEVVEADTLDPEIIFGTQQKVDDDSQ